VSSAETSADCIVVGAGLSGLYAASLLRERKRNVVVLEARDRIGGRIYTVHDEAGVAYDLGAQWIGPDHPLLIGLAGHLGLCMVRSEARSDFTFDFFGEPRTVRAYETWRAKIPCEAWLPLSVSRLSLIPLALLAIKVERVSGAIDARKPWDHPAASHWDGMSVSTLIRKSFGTAMVIPGIRQVADYIGSLISSAYCSDADKMSALGLVAQLRRCGGFMKIGEAERWIFRDGASRVTDGLAGKLPGAIRLDTRVERIGSAHGNLMEVGTSKGKFSARHVIVAVPPPLLSEIQWAVDVDQSRQQLAAGMRQGSVIKYAIGYRRNFWSEYSRVSRGVRYVGDRHPIDMVFEGTPEGQQTPARIVTFVRGKEAECWMSRPAAERRDGVLEALASYLGDEALTPRTFHEYDWSGDPWSRGGFGATYPPGVLTASKCSLGTASANGRVHWAGSETADKWPNFMEGALQAGRRAADEVCPP
jgi:monoamine oxidase